MASPIAATDSIAQTAATSAGSKLAANFDTFLKLLTTQLQNQDPLSPMDSNEFTSQLVQFASVEQAISSNQNLEKLVNFQLTNETSMAASYIGKQVTIGGDKAELENGAARWNYSLGATAFNTNITISDLAGNVVFETTGPTSKGEHPFTWDGRNNDGETAPDGTYKISIDAVDSNGNSITANTKIEGIVTSVDIEDGQPLLNVGGTMLRLSDIIKISAPPTTPANDEDTNS